MITFSVPSAYPYSLQARSGETSLAHRAFAMFANPQKVESRNGSYSDFIYGKYTKASDTEFHLEGFGTIVITGTPDNAYSLVITENGQAPYTLTAAKANQKPDSAITNALCRTWKIETFSLSITYNGKNIYRKTVAAQNINEINKELNDIFGENDFELVDTPEQVVFTKAGTYMVYYDQSNLGVSTWSWIDETQGLMRYSWDYDDMENDDDAGNVIISFSGNQLNISETIEETEDGETFSMEAVWGMSEVK